MLSVLFAIAFAALLAPGQAAAAKPRVSVSVPSVATAGDKLHVRGRVAGAKRARRVVLQQRAGGRWVRRARAGARGRRHSFALSWRAPGKRSVVTLRVAALRGGRQLAASRVRRVSITPTEVLAPSRVTDAPAAGSAGTLRYSGQAGAKVGDFVALDVGPKTPDGLLARVTATHTEGGDTVLDTVPASLIEAVPEGNISAAAVASAARRAQAHAAAAPQDFRSNFSCSGEVEASLTGSLSVRLDPSFKLNWSWGRVKSAEASATLRGDADIAAHMSAAGSCELEQTQVARWNAPQLRFFIGPVPVVITPRTTLYVAGKGEAGAAFDTGIHGFVSATAGLRYDGHEVHPTGSFDHGFDYTPPSIRAHASLGGRVIPSVEFLLYGQVGPRFDLSAGLQLDADPANNPWWTLTAPVELSAGLSVPHFEKFSVPQQTVYSTSFTIAQAAMDEEPAPQPDPEPEPEPTPHNVERAHISWDTDSTDVDLHVWDENGNHAYFNNTAAIPTGELSGDDTDGFGPEYYFEDSSAQTLTFGLCYYNDRDVGPTDVSVTLTDPDGTVHDFTQTLYFTGDYALLGSSPAGSGFTPEDGWCAP